MHPTCQRTIVEPLKSLTKSLLAQIYACFLILPQLYIALD